jgi:hypothetical protein
MRSALLCALLVAAPALADYCEIGGSGTVTTNRPFCGS